jgi:hypothetical protein
MNTITISEQDGSEPLPICRTQREWLVEQYKLEAMIALQFFSEDSQISTAIKHVRECQKCREWLHRIVPADVLRRQSRLVRYCCASMFVAVEEATSRNENKITFALFRGEDPCWMIDGRWSFISFCPWCGKKLPDKPFISEK